MKLQKKIVDVEQEMQLPSGLQLMDTQVAGHTFQANTAALGLLQDLENNCVYKPLGKPECGEREVNFYESLLNSKEGTILSQAKLLVPRYYHKLKLLVNQREYSFLKLEDLTCGLRRPCIMDIKVGKRTWDPLATLQKREVEEQKYVKCKQTLGLCLPGFQMYSLADGGAKVVRHSKEYGKKLDADGFRATIALFLNAQENICKPLVREVLQQLYIIRQWFNKQTIYNFYASSLLIAYDFDVLQRYLTSNCMPNGMPSPIVNGNNSTFADNSPFETETECTAKDAHQWIRVKMIDFAHVFPSDNQSLDSNYLFGLEHLIEIVEHLLQR